jgi:hypothetical protein
MSVYAHQHLPGKLRFHPLVVHVCNLRYLEGRNQEPGIWSLLGQIVYKIPSSKNPIQSKSSRVSQVWVQITAQQKKSWVCNVQYSCAYNCSFYQYEAFSDTLFWNLLFSVWVLLDLGLHLFGIYIPILSLSVCVRLCQNVVFLTSRKQLCLVFLIQFTSLHALIVETKSM